MKVLPIHISRLKELVNIWNDEIGGRFPMREELFKQNSFDDENLFIPGSFMAVNEKDEAVGFIISKRWQESLPVNMREDVGWIQVLLVHSNYRNQGIGSSLLAKSESALKGSGAKEILLGRDPWHYFPGIPAEYEKSSNWFAHRGYEYIGNDYDLIAEYEDAKTAGVPELDGIEITILSADEKEAFLQFMKRVFPGRWEYEAIHYFKKGGTGREFVILKKDREIIGFCRINDDQSPMIAQNVYWAPLFAETLGGIGPLGVDQKERGKGYGLAVVQAGVHYLRNRDINRIVIDWTGLVDFYGKLGYHIWKDYKKYRKVLTA